MNIQYYIYNDLENESLLHQFNKTVKYDKNVTFKQILDMQTNHLR